MQQMYNCPLCNKQVLFGTKFCGTCGNSLNRPPPQNEPPMYILGLNQHSKLILGFTIKDQSVVFLPSLTINGRLAMLPLGHIEDFRIFQKKVKDSIKTNWAHCQTHTCVCFTPMFKTNDPNQPYFSSTIYIVSGSPIKINEMDTIYSYMEGLRTAGDPYWKQVDYFFSNEPQRTFINTLIAHLQIECNWAKVVEQELSKAGLNYHNRVSEESLVVGTLQKI